MPTPTRPVTGAAIASAWGQEVHDHVFAPSGCEVAGADVTMLTASAIRTLPLDTAVDDPGGWLDAVNDRVEVPTDRAGLYLVIARIRTDEGAAADETRVYIRVNGSNVTRATEGQEGSTAVEFAIVTMVKLTAGDLITVHASQVGAGSRAVVAVDSLIVVRLGNELGA